MSVLERTIIKTGDKARTAGYYTYKTNPQKGEIPCYPKEDERIIVLELGHLAPAVQSCNNHPALWQLITVKKATSLKHTH